jgi:hypothetical protein
MSRRIIQLAIIGTLSLVAGAQARANIAYNGGRVLPSVRIVPMFYGNTWTASEIASTQSYLTEFADYIRGAKNPAGKQTLYAQYGVTGAQVVQLHHCVGCVDSNPRALGIAESKNIIHTIQQENGSPYYDDEVFVLLPGPGYTTSAGGCGIYGPEGDGKYYAVVPHDCASFKRTISFQVSSLTTSANFDGWAGAVSACSGHNWNFGNGDIALPWNNHLGGCPAFSADPNTPFDTKAGELLQVVVTGWVQNQTGNSDLKLLHAIRYPDGTWTPYGDVKVAVGSNPGDFQDVEAQATLGIFNHVVARGPAGKLYHTIRTDAGWTPFGDVNAANGANDMIFLRVGLANVNGDLHVCALNHLRQVMHAIRYQNGSWSGFGDVLAQTGAPTSVVEDIDCAGNGPEMHIAIVTSGGGLFHAIRSGSGGWSRLGDVKAEAGQTGFATRVSVAQFAGDLHLTVRMSNNTQFHTLRHPSGSWTPFSIPPNNLACSDQSSAGTQDLLHLVSIDSSSASLKHRTLNTTSSWSDLTPAGSSSAAVTSVTAASSLGY